MSSQQLQNFLSALQQKKPNQNNGGLPTAPSVMRPPQIVTPPPSTTGGLSLSTLSNLRQLIGRSAAARPSSAQVPPSSQSQSSETSQSHLVQDSPQAGGGLAALLLRGLPQSGQPTSNVATSSTRPGPRSSTSAALLHPPSAIQQQSWSSQQPPNGFVPQTSTQQPQPTAQQHFSRQASVPATASGSQYYGVPMTVAIGIVDSSMIHGNWELNERDIQNLFNLFGQTEWMKILCSPLGPGRVPDCCIAKFHDPTATRRIESELDGTHLEGMGKLVVSVFPSSLFDGVADEASLAALVSSKIQAKASTPPAWQYNNQIDQQSDTTAIASALAQALGGAGADASALLNSEVGRNAIAAVKADPSLLSAIQSQLQAIQTTPANIAQQQPILDRPKKRVCRLELVDLFGGHPEFDVASLIVGQNNSNIQYVLEEAKQKVDIDLDGIPCNTAPVAERLHLTVTALDEEAYTIAVETLEDLLQSICRQFVEYCASRKMGPVAPTAGFKRHEYIEGPDGKLVYLGQKERPKPWLQEQPPMRY